LLFLKNMHVADSAHADHVRESTARAGVLLIHARARSSLGGQQVRSFKELYCISSGLHLSSKYSNVPSPFFGDCPGKVSVMGLTKRVYQGFSDMIAAPILMTKD